MKNAYKMDYASPFVLKYEQLRELCSRALSAEQLFAPTFPAMFIGWCEQMDISFPTELKALIILRGGTVGSWKVQYEALQKHHDELLDTNSKNVQVNEELIQRLKELQQEARSSSKKPVSSAQNPKAYNSLMKILLAIAVKKFRHNPAASKNSSTNNIVSAVEELGMKINEETVRKWLKDAADTLDGEYEIPNPK